MALLELAFTKRILLATIERRGSDSSISSSGLPLSSWAPVPCDVAVHGLGRPNFRYQRHAEDRRLNQEVHLLF